MIASGDIAQSRHLATAIPGPRSADFAARAREALPAGLRSTQPAWAERAGGGIVVDVDGNRLIDLASGIATTTVGNAHPRVAAAVAEQARRLTHTCFLNQPYPGYLELAERLNTLTPGDHAKRTALFSTGAEALENAVKYARAHTGRSAVVVFDHAFHGRTALTMAMTAKADPYKRGFGPFPAEVYRAPAPGAGVEASAALAAIRSLVDDQLGAGHVACLVIEPIRGEGGFIVPPPGFLAELTAFCRERGILLVADEVQTGIARTGDLFACTHEGIVPDLITTAKGLGGGLPIAAVTGRAEVMDSAHPGGIGGTYAGNPVACAAALAVLDIVAEEDLCAAARRIGERAHAALAAAAADNPAIAEVRGRGAMIAAELVDPADGSPDPARTAETVRRCATRSVIALTAGTHGNVIRLLPPLSIGADLLDAGLAVLVEELAR